MNHMSAAAFSLAMSACAAVSFAQSLDECPAEKYKDCSAFRTSRTIQEYTPVMDSHISGYTRSKGSWKIFVGYGPPETCAKVSLTVDMGPLDVDRTYDRAFHRGGGVISDSGPFMHRMGEVESGLRILVSSCRVPDPASRELGAEAEERQELEDERERLALEAERERLALEVEREQQVLEEERERVVMEAERQRREEEARLAQIRRAREEERERQRLALERQRQEERRARKRVAELQREQERERMEEEESARRRTANAWAVAGILTGITAGIADGLAQRNGGGRPGTAFLEALAGMGNSTGMDSGETGGGSCAQAQRRIEQKLSSQNLSEGGMGICGTARHYARTLQDVRRELASAGCPTHALRAYDQAIAQVNQTARASCN